MKKNLKNNEKIMKKITSILLLGIIFISCDNNLIKEKDHQIVLKINYTKVDNEWSIKDHLYIVRTQDLDFATDSLYKVGDTLKLIKNDLR